MFRVMASPDRARVMALAVLGGVVAGEVGVTAGILIALWWTS